MYMTEQGELYIMFVCVCLYVQVYVCDMYRSFTMIVVILHSWSPINSASFGQWYINPLDFLISLFLF